ncbi:hypothetical protein MSAN_00144700 [Mycena sanguinolenta]|uniref:Uncharacterized protein n=1 Tax=Mycena sanguinolenta TaxID=230812 RepID=A0A8H7DJ26_9AGAR|nr:hypothetical protein MSAN_00144700 [Mycena sanguinolenta]
MHAMHWSSSLFLTYQLLAHFTTMPSLPRLSLVTVLSAVATPFRRRTSASGGSSATDLLCLSFNLNTNTTFDGAQLISRVVGGASAFIECYYSDGDVCKGTEAFKWGPKRVPLQSIRLKSCMTPTAENLACVYADAALYTYSQHTGLLSTGAGICPQTATGSPECQVSSSVGLSSAQSSFSKDAKGFIASSSTSNSNQLSPALIALIVLNGFFVIIVLALGGAWLKRLYSGIGKRYDSKYCSLSLGTGTKNDNQVDGDTDEVPLTHGAPRRYRDEVGGGSGRTSRRNSCESMDFQG